MTYSRVAIILHWIIAAGLLGNLLLGWWMHEALEESASQARAVAAIQWHKSLGLTILVLSLLRLGWRLAHRPPPLPAGMRAWERRLASLTHLLFYGLMIAIPLSGWIYVSTQWRDGAPLAVPTLWFNLIEVPHLFGLAEAAPSLRQSVAATAGELHEWLAWSLAGLLGLHVAAALKHQFVTRDGLLGRMWPRRGWPWLVALPILLMAALILIGVLRPAGGAAQLDGDGAITSAYGGWIIDPDASEIGFAGTHAGARFRGVFTRWQADLRIAPANPAASRITATIQTGSATDGIRLHDETLPEEEWFDVVAHPVAHFESGAIEPDGEGGYRLSGALTIKGHTVPVTGLSLRLDGDRGRIRGEFSLDRAAVNLGMESDPRGQWVSREIEVSVDVRARAP